MARQKLYKKQKVLNHSVKRLKKLTHHEKKKIPPDFLKAKL